MRVKPVNDLGPTAGKHTSHMPATSALILLLLTPYIFPGIFPFDVNIALAVTAAAFFIAFTITGKRSIKLPKTLSILFTLILCIQLILSGQGELLATQAWKLYFLLYCMAFLMLIAGASSAPSTLTLWMKSYIAVATTWAGIGLFVWLGGTGSEALLIGPVTLVLPPSSKISGPFNQGNIFAAAIGIAWLFAHWLYMQNKKPLYALLILLFSAILFDTLSRGGWISYVLTLLLLLLALRANWSIIICRLLPLWLAGLALGYMCLEYSVSSENITVLTQTASYSLVARVLIWSSAIAEFLNAPFSGVGWGQFQPHFWEAKPVASAWLEQYMGVDITLDSVPFSAHNIFLHLLAESGLFALLAFVWGCWKLLHITYKLSIRGRSVRIPFALAALAFLLQAQINIIYQSPVILLLAALFTGIALAPWLRKSCWTLKLYPAIKGSVITLACLMLVWSAQLTYHWFKLEQAIQQLDLAQKSTVQQLVSFSDQPRMHAMALTWLGFVVAQKQEHLPLLQWMQAELKVSVHELPSLLAYQVLFYSLQFTQDKAACRTGQLIAMQGIHGEKNSLAYQQVCNSTPIDHYTFGYLAE